MQLLEVHDICLMLLFTHESKRPCKRECIAGALLLLTCLLSFGRISLGTCIVAFSKWMITGALHPVDSRRLLDSNTRLHNHPSAPPPRGAGGDNRARALYKPDATFHVHQNCSCIFLADDVVLHDFASQHLVIMLAPP